MRRSNARIAAEDAQLDQIITELEQNGTTFSWADGSTAYTKMLEWMKANPDDGDYHILARKAMDRFDKARRPCLSTQGYQLTLFQPDALLPLGGGDRVRMSKAKEPELRLWRKVEVQEFQASMVAHNAKLAYIDIRINAFSSRDETLLALEQRMFSYSPSTEDRNVTAECDDQDVETEYSLIDG